MSTLKKVASSSTTFMTIDIQKKIAWRPMISNFAFYFRVTKKAVKTSSLEAVKELADKYDVVGIDEGQFF